MIRSIHLYESIYTVCPNKKETPVLSVRYLHCHVIFNQTIYALLSRAFSLLSFDTKHNDDISMHDWKGPSLTRACQNWFAQNNSVDMTKFRLANPCRNKESKHKKHDKRDKRYANEYLFNTSLCSETWQTPLSL